MNALNSTAKRPGKRDRERNVLLGLVECYLKTGKPVGSNTLKEAGFDNLSSATIRNYFANLEEEGYLVQQHTSGGRIPTHAAFRLYATENANASSLTPQQEKTLNAFRNAETREIAAFLQKAGETLSALTNTAIFLSAPRFDNDYIVGLKLLPIDHNRCLCVIITDFGVVQSELMHVGTKLSAFAAKRMESYFNWRLTGHDQPEHLEPEEEALAQQLYNEIMVRYIVSYSHFTDPELYRTGFSKLLAYPEFRDATVLAQSLALFEDARHVRLLVKECCKVGQLKFWIGDDLATYSTSIPDCSVIAIPYMLNQRVAGAVGLLGPTRMPYAELIAILRSFASSISEALTRNLYKYKITFRQPHSGMYALESDTYGVMKQAPLLLERT